MNYWIVKHDVESIEERPGWIWRSRESAESRTPLITIKSKRVINSTFDYFRG